MADDADVSQARMEAEEAQRKASRNWTMLPDLGQCYNCLDYIDGRFCDADCLSDWERREAARRRNGRG